MVPFLSWHAEEQMRPFSCHTFPKLMGKSSEQDIKYFLETMQCWKCECVWDMCNSQSLTLFHRVVKAAPERRDGLLHLALLQGLGKKSKI